MPFINDAFVLKRWSTAKPEYKNTTRFIDSTINTIPELSRIQIDATLVDPFNLVLVPLALGFVMQMYTSEIVGENVKNLVSFVQLYGVKEWEYNFVRFIFDYMRYVILLVATWVCICFIF